MLAKFGLDGNLVWNQFHLQGEDQNFTDFNEERMAWLKVSPDERYVAMRARLFGINGGEQTAETIAVYNTSKGELVRGYFNWWNTDDDTVRKPVFLKFDFSPDSSKIFIVGSKEKISSDGDNSKYK